MRAEDSLTVYWQQLNKLAQTATPQGWYNLGVAASEFGLACWYAHRKRTARDYWQQSAICHLRARNALKAVEGSLQWCIVRCDELCNTARMTMLDGNLRVVQKAIHDMQWVAVQLELLPDTPSKFHQLGVAYSFLGYMQSGSFMGLPNNPQSSAWNSFSRAGWCFQQANLHDASVAHAQRELFMLRAMAVRAAGDKQSSRLLIKIVIENARQFQDTAQIRRARIIGLFGQWGDRLLHVAQYGGTHLPIDIKPLRSELIGA